MFSLYMNWIYMNKAHRMKTNHWHLEVNALHLGYITCLLSVKTCIFLEYSQVGLRRRI